MQCMTQATRDSIGNSMGKILHMTGIEEEGGKGNYLSVRVRMDISKPLSRVRKIWSDGRVIGLPNFCYWCGQVTYDERDCDLWLRSKRTLCRDDQQFGAWMRVEVDLLSRKTSLTVDGTHSSFSGPPPRHREPGPPKRVELTRITSIR
ncbi:hypothetical protein CFP56_024291 [Quercus suber]|uniref:Zinc knuckle CX2CX4HX4C domain-containing protein n=1 Tax=Quercus suber TaxID=58331 RepID=A0AAW0MH95_QUESU